MLYETISAEWRNWNDNGICVGIWKLWVINSCVVLTCISWERILTLYLKQCGWQRNISQDKIMSTIHCKEQDCILQRNSKASFLRIWINSCCHLDCTIVSVSTTAWILKAAHMDPAENIFNCLLLWWFWYSTISICCKKLGCWTYFFNWSFTLIHAQYQWILVYSLALFVDVLPSDSKHAIIFVIIIFSWGKSLCVV